MKNVLYTLVSLVALLSSCANSYNIQGTSNVSTLDGHKLYLTVVNEDAVKHIDSCDVVHGQFAFSGALDSTRMAGIFMDRVSILPVVLESGDIVIKLDNTQQTIGGTPLNDKLYKFLQSFGQLQNESSELVHKQSQAIMDGLDMDVVNRQLAVQDAQITQKMDKLLTSFVTENFDNVLGPGIFMMVTSDYEIPVFTPWIEDILSKASDRFKNDPYVKQYVEAAKHNQDLMNGMAEQPGMPAPPAPGTIEGAAVAPPTPAELASDTLRK
ncbi:MAG: DUF4369 domain-containing protein [Prevotella sp.]|nr:DUF4369 domain-containing protein [Prevotella sp.]